MKDIKTGYDNDLTKQIDGSTAYLSLEEHDAIVAELKKQHAAERAIDIRSVERAAVAEAKLRVAGEALGFYADKDNWDTDQFSPTIWDDGAIDLGKRAKKALEELARD